MDAVGLSFALLGLLALSGAFSGSETALFSISHHRLREMRRSRDRHERAVFEAMERPRRILVTILLGNLVVNILSSSLGTAFAIRVSGSAGIGVAAATLVMTLLVLVFGEITPKTLAYRRAETVARVTAGPLLLLARALQPLVGPLLALTRAVLGHEPPDTPTVGLDEAETMLRLAHDEGEVDSHERDLVAGVLELGASPVEDAMTPRTEVFTLPAATPLSEAREAVRRADFSKVPVATDDPDHLIGFVTALDLLLGDDDATVGSIARKARWVPEVNSALGLLEEFRATGERIAFVVDEHGHLSGVVTLTDLLEEISGEMIEVGDVHKVVYERLGPDRVVVPARMEIRFFNEEFGTRLASAEAETLGGMLLERFGRVPVADERFELGSIVARVIRAEPNRVVTLEMWIRPVEDDGEPADDERDER